ncbi:MAG: hypothetical protein HOV66_03090, partial [Streptomycetaceae bacterium]|nr:hypothetical protein [Streptomycetaceae bacterium]
VAQLAFESPATDINRDFVQAPANLSYGNKAERRKIHRIVYGDSLKSRGGHIDLDSIEAEAADLAHRDIGQAERFFGNRIVYGAGAWLEGDLWDARAEPREVPAGTAVAGGFDGSDVDDWTVLRLQTEDGYQFTPAYGPDRRPTIWNPAEFGGQVPRLEVAAAIEEVFETYRVARLYYDPPGWKSEGQDWESRYGEKVVLRWETYRIIQMHAAAQRLHTDVVKAESAFRHDGDKQIAIMIRNTRKLARPNLRYVLGKPSQQQKIDGAISSILADEAAGDVTAAGAWPKPRVRRKVTVFTR